MINVYNPQRSIFFLGRRLKAYSLFDAFHSYMNMHKANMSIGNAGNTPDGLLNNDSLNIFENISTVCSILSAWNIIQAKFTNKKTVMIFLTEWKLNMIFSSKFTFGRGLLFNKRGKKNNACNIPQNINVQLAPCHKPLTRNMMKVLRITFPFEHLLPPKGMYM